MAISVHACVCVCVCAVELCADVQCYNGAMCHNGSCVCPQNCPLLDEPICANDSVTYQNECAMRSAACNLGVDLFAKHDGECADDIEDSEQSSGLEGEYYRVIFKLLSSFPLPASTILFPLQVSTFSWQSFIFVF